MLDQPARAIENMHKFIYLANEYKGSKTAQLFRMFSFPLLDFQVASYLAEDMGFVKITEKKKGDHRFEVVKLPEEWMLGEEVSNLIKTLTYVFQRLEKMETDIAEWELNSWMEGYELQDQFIAVKWLLNEGILTTYEVEYTNPKEMNLPNTIQTCYTLAGNESKRWGEKQVPDKKRIVRSK